jgi:hypothetical protein
MSVGTTGDAAPGRIPGCAVVTRMLGGSPAGTATAMRSWLLIEQPGPWSADALEQVLTEALPPERREILERLKATAGLRPLLIRKPGRHERRAPTASRTVLVGGGEPGNRWLERLDISDLRELAALDLEAVAEGRGGIGHPVTGPVFLVCTHGSKDMCCALLGRPLATALGASHPGRSWETSHLGGDRWAGNLLVVPDGYMHGHLDAGEATVVAKAAFRGQVEPAKLRGRTSAASQWSQYAEIEVRRETGLSGLDDVVAVREEALREDSASETRRVTVHSGQGIFEVTVRRHAAVARGTSRCAEVIAPSGYVTEAITQVASAVA